MPAPRSPLPAARRVSSLVGAPSLTCARGPLAQVTLRSRDTLAALDVIADRGAGRVGEWASAVAETHARLVDPAGCRPLPPGAGSSWGASAMSTLTGLPTWGELRAASALHPSIARDAARDLCAALATAIRLDDVPRDGAATSPEAAQGALDDAQRDLGEARAAFDALDGDGDGDGAPDDGDDAPDADADAPDGVGTRRGRGRGRGRSPAQVRDRLRAATDAVEAARRDLHRAQGRRTALSDRARQAHDQIARAAQVAAQAASARATACRTLSEAGIGDSTGCFGGLPDDLVDAVARTPGLAAILRECGAIREAARSARVSPIVPGREGMVGPSTGGLRDVADLRPLESAALAGGLGRAMQVAALVRLVGDRAATSAKGGGGGERGDVVVLVDRSGSMSGPRETWARALALAITVDAVREGRRVAVSLFDDVATPAVVVRSVADLPAIVRTLSGGSNGGGTTVASALAEAHRALPHLRHGGRGADVLLITDGEIRDDEVTATSATFPHGAKLRCALVETARTAPIPRAVSTWHVRADGGTGRAAAVSIAAAVGA